MLFSGKKKVATEKRVFLKGVDWAQFTQVLDELGRDRTVHITYDRGRLEMTTPLEVHDRTQRLLDSMLLVVADESGETVHGLGAVLLTKPIEKQAIQPFNAYYFDYPPRPITNRELDVTTIAPPDLVIDVMLGEGTIGRATIFEGFEIPEVWVYRAEMTEESVQGTIQILQWTKDGYVSALQSLAFPILTIDKIEEFIAQSDTMGLSQSLTVLRSWVADTIPS
jgi:Uma2 family endonuclease